MKATDPVYPIEGTSGWEYRGMNHRTYIAAQIMAGFAASPFSVRSDLLRGEADSTVNGVARLAVEWADCLISALSKKKGEGHANVPSDGLG